MTVELIVLGSGDAFCSDGRGNACYLLRDGLGALCVDFGPTALMQLKTRHIAPNDVDAIFITHLHGDHFGGVHLFLIDAEYSSRRERPLTICGPIGVKARLERWHELAFGKASPGRRFQLNFIELEAGQTFNILGRRVKAFPMAHMQSTDSPLGYRFELPDACIALSGDTAWSDVLIELAQGTDLFVCDCTEASGTNGQHLTWEALAPKVDRLRTKHLLLSHLGASMRQAAATIEGGHVSLAEDGLCLSLSADQKTTDTGHAS